MTGDLKKRIGRGIPGGRPGGLRRRIGSNDLVIAAQVMLSGTEELRNGWRDFGLGCPLQPRGTDVAYRSGTMTCLVR